MRLFHKLLTTYVAIVIVILGVLALVLSLSLSAFLYSEQKQRLGEIGQTITEQVSSSQKGEIPAAELVRTISAIDQSLNARVWVLSPQGQITLDSRGRLLNRRGTSFVDPQLLGPILEGEELTQVVTLLELETEMLLVGLPVYVDGRVSGAVLLMTPVSDVQATLNSIFRLFWPAAGLSLIAALILAMMVSRSISRPLRELSKAAMVLAEGDFSRQVTPRGDKELRLLASSFNQMANQLKELEDLRRDFIASVSHELRSPLTSIRGFVQGVLDGKIPPEKQHSYLQRSLNEIRRLSMLVTNLLDLSALEGKAAPLNLKEYDLRELVNLSLAAMEPQISQHQMSVDIQVPTKPSMVFVDHQRFQQVLMNIINNCIMHIPPGNEMKIHINPVKNGYELHLADTGPGIPPHQMPHIFKPFYHGMDGGTGLGLSIAKALVEAHQGSIRVSNLPEGGSNFTIWLPQHK